MINAYPQNAGYMNQWPFQNGFQNAYQAVPQPMVTANVPQTDGQIHTIDSVVWVQGESAAKAFSVNPGKTVMLLDSESDKFYIKQADQYGRPLPLKCFRYTEDVVESGGAGADFVTRKEFDELKASIENLVTPVNAKEGE